MACNGCVVAGPFDYSAFPASVAVGQANLYLVDFGWTGILILSSRKCLLHNQQLSDYRDGCTCCIQYICSISGESGSIFETEWKGRGDGQYYMGLLFGLALGAVNVGLMLSNNELNVQVSLSRFLVSLNPAVLEEIAMRTLFLPFATACCKGEFLRRGSGLPAGL